MVPQFLVNSSYLYPLPLSFLRQTLSIILSLPLESIPALLRVALSSHFSDNLIDQDSYVSLLKLNVDVILSYICIKETEFNLSGHNYIKIIGQASTFC